MNLAAIPLVGLGLMLQACAAVDAVQRFDAEVPPFANARAGDDASLPPIDGFLALDASMREFVQAQIADVADPLARLRRLAAALLDADGLDMRYDEDLTLTAPGIFRQRAGNCLSFTALVVVLAREAGLEASFQDVPVLPQWRVTGDAFVVERHVNAVVRAGTHDFVLDFRPPDAVTYSSARKITDANATAQYFGNLGVERFAAGDLEGAYRLFRRGLQADPLAVSLWVNVGVVLARNRQGRHAEQAYRNALVLDPENLSALNNLALLFERRGDVLGSRRLLARVEAHRRRNPYYLFWRGDQHLQSGALDEALDSFTAAVQILPAEAEFHFALARTYLALGRVADAEASFKAALELAASDSIRERFLREYPQGPRADNRSATEQDATPLEALGRPVLLGAVILGHRGNARRQYDPRLLR